MMKISTLHRATAIEDAYDVLRTHKENVVLGGGTWLRLSAKEVSTAIDLSGLALDEIKETDTEVIVGAMTTLNRYQKHPAIQAIGNGILAKATSTILGDAFRNIATVGGSVAGRFAFSDVITSLLAFDVTLVFYPFQTISLTTFLSVRQVTGILTEIRIRKEKAKGFFYKVTHTANDFSTLSVAITKSELKTTIVIGARPAIAARAISAMAMLDGVHDPNDDFLMEVAYEAVRSLSFATNHQASKEYRETLASHYVRRGLKEVFANDR